MFLTSLCISDIVSALTSPVIVYRKITGYYDFSLPEIFCKLPIAVEYWTSCVTMQHILVISAFRLFATLYPHNGRMIKRIHAKIIIIAIWISMGVIGAVPYLTSVTKGTRLGPSGQNTNTCLMNKKLFYILKGVRFYSYPFIWYIPMALVVVMSVLLALLLLRRKASGPSNNNDNKELKAILQLGAIIASFFLGYFPDLGFRLFIINFRGKYGNIWMPRYAWLASVLSHFLLKLSECLNPLLYNLASRQIWTATKVFFETCRCKKKPNKSSNNSNTIAKTARTTMG